MITRLIVLFMLMTLSTLSAAESNQQKLDLCSRNVMVAAAQNTGEAFLQELIILSDEANSPQINRIIGRAAGILTRSTITVAQATAIAAGAIATCSGIDALPTNQLKKAAELVNELMNNDCEELRQEIYRFCRN